MRDRRKCVDPGTGDFVVWSIDCHDSYVVGGSSGFPGLPLLEVPRVGFHSLIALGETVVFGTHGFESHPDAALPQWQWGPRGLVNPRLGRGFHIRCGKIASQELGHKGDRSVMTGMTHM